MLIIYYILVTLVYILALPVLVFFCFKPKHKKALPARFFLNDNPSFSSSGVWFHTCSLGEVRSLKPFIDTLVAEKINISAITQTGFHEAKKYSSVQVRYLPF